MYLCGEPDNQRICAEHIGWEQSRFRIRKVSPLSHEVVQRLPRDIVKGILGNAALHMAVRDPDNGSAERLALETKNRLFQGLHRLLQNPQDERRDVLFCCIILLFAMDVSHLSHRLPLIPPVAHHARLLCY
jgi:hypothetical protein